MAFWMQRSRINKDKIVRFLTGSDFMAFSSWRRICLKSGRLLGSCIQHSAMMAFLKNKQTNKQLNTNKQINKQTNKNKRPKAKSEKQNKKERKISILDVAFF